MERRLAYLPLHGGRAPPYLFQRMVKLAGAMTMAIVDEYGPREMLRRLSDPWWFQAFGCVLGFDWHSSGVTTVACGALKEAQKHFGADLGIIVAGGKGGTSRKTPEEIAKAADRHAITSGEKLIYASRMSAKVDSAAVQDGYQLYHRCFFFNPAGSCCVVQQGLNEARGNARRYHWLGETVEDFVCEPRAVVQDLTEPAAPITTQAPALNHQLTLNMVAAEAEANRNASAELIRESPDKLLRLMEAQADGPTLFAPAHHPVLPADVYRHSRRVLVLSAMISETVELGRCTRFGDGVLTKRNTFQKYFEQQELQQYIEDALDMTAIPVALGVFYVFRDPAEQQDFLSARSRRTIDWPQFSARLGLGGPPKVLWEALYREHKELLERLVSPLVSLKLMSLHVVLS